MRALAILSTALLACRVTAMTSTAPVVTAPAPDPCRAAYAAYEVEWRHARTEDLREHMAGYEELMEEILVEEVATLPSRTEVGELREIYAVVEAFLWNTPWPRALAATDVAIERCGEQAARP